MNESDKSAMLDAAGYHACRDFTFLLVNAFAARTPIVEGSTNAYRLARLLDAQLKAIGNDERDYQTVTAARETCRSGIVAILRTCTQRPLDLAVVAFALGKFDTMLP